MAEAALSRASLYLDDLSQPRLLPPQASSESRNLQQLCRDFMDDVEEFEKVVGGLGEMVNNLAKVVESEKMKAIGVRSQLASAEKQRTAQQQKLQALIAEKKAQLERYRVQYEALLKVEAEQEEFIEQFVMQK
uniref:Intraflagellar transport 20 homolog (Chlamydomonas) n=1 Tax=Eptatretus burgeri TaxID=7764 RepID=A0A8C4RBX7_EPTBU